MKPVALTLTIALLLAGATALAADGDLDGGFAGSGTATLDLGGDEVARATAVQADGKLVVAGSTDAGTSQDFAIARYDPDGTLDLTFSGDGHTAVSFGGDDAATAVTALSDGRIAVAGATTAGATASDPSDFAVAVLTSDGDLDTSFSGDGRQTVQFGDDDRAQALAADASGRLVVGGTHDDGSPTFAFARLTTAGALDAE